MTNAASEVNMLTLFPSPESLSCKSLQPSFGDGSKIQSPAHSRLLLCSREENPELIDTFLKNSFQNRNFCLGVNSWHLTDK